MSETELASAEEPTVGTAAAAPVADPVLLASRDLAREALAEITDPGSIGSDAGHEVHEDRVLTLLFECRLPGYPGWHWAATLARVDEQAPVTVLEVELLAGPGSVVAPEWVPWSVRLAQFREAQARQAAEEASAAEAAAAELDDEASADIDDDEIDGDILDNDFSDFDDEIDGVDLEDDHDVDADDEDDDDTDEESDDDFEGFSAER
ncbi:DUF3027 domain-containing protein [Leucobacter zeae]|nr:DUF3027 domain-containing protein [Leucobacter zeae]